MYAHSPVRILMCVKDGNNFHECKYAVRLIAWGRKPHFDNRSVSTALFYNWNGRKVVNFKQAKLLTEFWRHFFPDFTVYSSKSSALFDRRHVLPAWCLSRADRPRGSICSRFAVDLIVPPSSTTITIFPRSSSLFLRLLFMMLSSLWWRRTLIATEIDPKSMTTSATKRRPNRVCWHNNLDGKDTFPRFAQG